MKFFLFACALFIAGASALPRGQEVAGSSLITNDKLARAVERLRRAIVNDGLDPLVLESYERNYYLPLFRNVRLFIDQLVFSGASDIVVHRLNYIRPFSISFDLELPQLVLEASDVVVSSDLFGKLGETRFSGRVAVSGVRLSGRIGISFMVEGGRLVTSPSSSFRVGGINADVNLNVLGSDVSAAANNNLNVRVPQLLEKNKDAINRFINGVLRIYGDFLLGDYTVSDL
ncbi:unnamed protein product [Leptosia nina]|uniref:Uncharacterized protein n=1 Tax=Leptosia nina TaxID=320188 RepID=A0AAV1JJW8_9NEOP